MRAALAAAIAVAVLAGAGPASAHLRSGTVAVDYRASIAQPITTAYSAQIYQSDHGLSLTLRPGHVVVMLGYLHEPVFRLDGHGLSVNAASPTALAMHLLTRADAVDATAAHWRLQPDRRAVSWHDSRVQGLPAGVRQGIWTVPLVIDGHGRPLHGELRRFPAPSPWPWLAVLSGWLAAGAVPLLRWRVLRRRDCTRGAALGFARVAALATAVFASAFAFDAYASPGTWIVAVDGIAFLAAGIWVILSGRRNLHVAAAIWVGLVSLAIALLDGPIFLHPIVLAVLPGTLMRLLVVTAIGAGVDAAALASLHFSEIAETVRESSLTLGLPASEHDAGRRPGGASGG
ncbi:MAG: hypothetical protein ACRDNJ_08340 [Solirubrobacteraceae bacterium]